MTTEEIGAAIEDEGYAVVPNLQSQDEVSKQRAWFNGVSQLPPDEIQPMEPEYESGSQEGPRQLRKVRRVFWYDPDFWRTTLERSGIFPMARRLVKSPALIFHAAFFKPPELGSEVEWHQDQALWSADHPGALTVWIALTAARKDNGCIEGIRFSHRLGLVEHTRRPQYRWHDAIAMPENQNTNRVVLEIGEGDAIVWHRYFVHASGPNRSSLPRTAMALVFAESRTASAASDHESLDGFAPE